MMFEFRYERRPGPDRRRTFVGVAHVQRQPVGLGEDGDRRDAELVTGAIDTQAISPRLAIRTFFEHQRSIRETAPDRTRRLALGDEDRITRPVAARPDRVADPQRLDVGQLAVLVELLPSTMPAGQTE